MVEISRNLGNQLETSVCFTYKKKVVIFAKNLIANKEAWPQFDKKEMRLDPSLLKFDKILDFLCFLETKTNVIERKRQ